VIDKLIQALMFGCGYSRIADATSSATTMRRRRDEGIRARRGRTAAAGSADRLPAAVRLGTEAAGAPAEPTRAEGAAQREPRPQRGPAEPSRLHTETTRREFRRYDLRLRLVGVTGIEPVTSAV
jgi:hypothetical protein